LQLRHRREQDRRITDRLKAILLAADKGWTYCRIAEALLLDEETISQHVHDDQEKGRLCPENGGSQGKLDKPQVDALTGHLELITYLKISDICASFESNYVVTYTVSGMTAFFKNHDFSVIIAIYT
jgi:transposase